ncbi:MAG: hypothetical protein DSY90_02650 [Deltaproteobacteria bacterium]|nr:MAG: hypothetical protein DSY90_02650 [Deltaproteobacteria bacterium]
MLRGIHAYGGRTTRQERGVQDIRSLMILDRHGNTMVEKKISFAGFFPSRENDISGYQSRK